MTGGPWPGDDDEELQPDPELAPWTVGCPACGLYHYPHCARRPA